MTDPTCSDQISQASESAVKAVLLSLCKDRDVEKTVMTRLDALMPQSNTSRPHDGKRKATDELAICIQCEEPFSEDDNHYGDCLYHPGDMEVDYDHDIWADHDENCHGPIDSKELRKENPEGFIWDCCEEPGDSLVGCTESRHEADPHKAGRDASPTPSEIDSEDYDEEDDLDAEGLN